MKTYSRSDANAKNMKVTGSFDWKIHKSETQTVQYIFVNNDRLTSCPH